MKNPRLRSVALLVATFCLATTSVMASPLDPIKARWQLRDSLLSSLDAIEREAQKTSDSNIFRETTAGMMIGAIILPILLSPFDRNSDSSSSERLKSLLRANVLDQVLDTNHITAQDDRSIIFALKSDLCDKIALFTGNMDPAPLGACRAFLDANSISFKLEEVANHAMRLALLHNPAQDDFDAFVFAVDVSRTALGVELDLKTLNEFFLSARQSQIIPEQLMPEFNSFEGIVKFSIRFDNLGLSSGCHDNGSICLIFNVLKPISLVSTSTTDPLSFFLGASSADGAAIEFSGNGDSSFYLRLNVAEVNALYGADTTFYLNGLTGEIIVPNQNEDGEASVIFRDLSFGKKSASFASDGKKLTLDLNKDAARVVKTMAFIWSEISGVVIDSSYFDLRLGLAGQDDGKKSQEDVRFTVIAGDNSPGRFNVNLNSSPRNPSDSPEDVLFDGLNKLSNTICNEMSLIKVEKGTLAYEQSYVTNEATGSGAWSASAGECIGYPAGSNDEDKDEL